MYIDCIHLVGDKPAPRTQNVLSRLAGYAGLLALAMAQLLLAPIAHAITPALAAGENFTLALDKNGRVFAWGNNSAGQLGDNSTVMRPTPIQVQGLPVIKSIAAGRLHALAIDTEGSIWAWGQNLYGQLGDGSTISRQLPVKIGGLGPVLSIVAGYTFSAALLEDNTVWTWGQNNIGQLGDGTFSSRLTPKQLVHLDHIQAIAAGSYHMLALRNNNGADIAVHGWGDNSYGQLGLGNTTAMNTPTRVPLLTNIRSIYAGYGSSYAIEVSGTPAPSFTTWAWGLNQSAQLGNGKKINSNTPLKVTLPATSLQFQCLTVGSLHVIGRAGVCGDSQSGDLYVWGNNASKQISEDDDTAILIPEKQSKFSNMKIITAGLKHTIGMVEDLVTSGNDGLVWSAGASDTGQRGTGSSSSQVISISQVVGVGGLGYLNLQSSADIPPDTQPDGFAFAQRVNVGAGVEIVSDPVRITGLDTPSELSIVNGQYARYAHEGDARLFSSDALTGENGLRNGEWVVVKHTSAASASTSTTTTLTIGGVAATFTSTTGSDSAPPQEAGGGCTMARGNPDAALPLLLLGAMLLRTRRWLRST